MAAARAAEWAVGSGRYRLSSHAVTQPVHQQAHVKSTPHSKPVMVPRMTTASWRVVGFRMTAAKGRTWPFSVTFALHAHS